MIAPGYLELTLYRWQPNIISFAFVGRDFTGATFKAQVRAYRDAPDPALISLANASAGSQGISVSVATIDGVVVSTVTLQFDETTVEALPFPNPKGTDPKFVFDLVIDPTDDIKRRWIEGPCIIHGGSTQV